MKKFTLPLFAARALCATALAALLVGCSGQKEQRIVIVSTNDMHAAIERFPQLATLVDSLRATGDPVILADAGDWSTGNPYADLYPHRGAPQIELMNDLGYDIATLGNHDFDNGIDTLAKRLSQAHFRVVVANMHTNGAMPQPAPYCFIDAGGIRLGFLGLITVTDSGFPDGFPSSFGAATFSDPIATARQYAFLKDSCDVLIALTHIGFAKDSMLAAAMPRIQIIIGGHSHTVLPEGRWMGGGLPAGGTLITQTGSKLRYAGVTTLTVNDDGQVTGIDNRLVELDKLAPRPEVAKIVAQFKNNPAFTQVAGRAADHFNKNAIMSLYADAMREGTGADVALANRGGVRIDYLNPGPVTRGDVFMLEPFGNKAVVATMTAEQIKAMIINKFNSEGKESHSIELWPSGMSYEVVKGADGQARDVQLHIAAGRGSAGGGQRDNAPRGGSGGAGAGGGLYRVAMSDYVATAYHFPRSGEIRPTGTPITTFIINYIQRHTPIVPDPSLRGVVK